MIFLLSLLLTIVFLTIAYFILSSSEDEKENINVKFEVKKDNNEYLNLIKNWLDNLDIKIEEFKKIKSEIHKKIIWLDNLINSILVTLLSNWHLLVEWVPGLAKTKTIETLAKVIDLDFKRIQFTPDMLPADIIWTQIYNQKINDFEIKLWPIFTNILLADEINRTTPKVQSALLEWMQEKKVSIGWKDFTLPNPFFVLATQNPIEQEWTYPLPEAQIDRFLFKVIVDYPKSEEEKKILEVIENEKNIDLERVLTKEEILKVQTDVEKVYLSDKLKDFIVKIIEETRKFDPRIVYWASPRWSIGLMIASKAVAFLKWRDYVELSDIFQVLLNVLRHRVILSYDAKIDNVKADDIIIEKILNVI